MKAAMVMEAGRAPVYGDVKDPVPASGDSRIAVAAAALSPVVKARASGTHYSASGGFPLSVGLDGVGRRDDGRRVYFFMPSAPYGSMAEKTVVPPSRCVTLPDGLDDVTAAAIATPAMSSWAALKERARFAAGETVLVNGATGTSGRLAVQVAKYLGAKTIIATGRNAAALQSLKSLGADVTIRLAEYNDALEDTFKEQFAGGVDVVLDYLWGPSAERLLAAASKAGPVAADPLRSDRQRRWGQYHLARRDPAIDRHRTHGQRARQRPARSHHRSHRCRAAGRRPRPLRSGDQATPVIRGRTELVGRRLHPAHRFHDGRARRMTFYGSVAFSV